MQELKLTYIFANENGELYVRTGDLPYFEKRIYWEGEYFQLVFQLPLFRIADWEIKSKHFLN